MDIFQKNAILVKKWRVIHRKVKTIWHLFVDKSLEPLAEEESDGRAARLRLPLKKIGLGGVILKKSK